MNHDAPIKRREILKTMGLIAGTATALPVIAGVAKATETPLEQAKPRYRENDHVKRFYALNRL